MKVTLSYFGQLRQIAGSESEKIDCGEGATLQDVLKETAGRYGDGFSEIVFSGDGGVHPSLLVVINDLGVDKDRPVALNDNDNVTLLPAIAGG